MEGKEIVSWRGCCCVQVLKDYLSSLDSNGNIIPKQIKLIDGNRAFEAILGNVTDSGLFSNRRETLKLISICSCHTVSGRSSLVYIIDN